MALAGRRQGIVNELENGTITGECSKIRFRRLHVPLCGIFEPNSGYIASYHICVKDFGEIKFICLHVHLGHPMLRKVAEKTEM